MSGTTCAMGAIDTQVWLKYRATPTKEESGDAEN
jgi:hypothetical protein